MDWRTENEIIAELGLLNYLRESGISVSFPITDTAGKEIQQIQAPEGNRFAVLFSFAEGESIRNPSEKVCYHLGEQMAKIHHLTVNKKIDRKNYDSDSLVRWAYLKAAQFFSRSSNEMKYFEEANAIISTTFKNVSFSDLRYGVVHLDLWYENMKVTNDIELTFFDFDNCGNGWLFLDISYSLMLIFRNEPDKAFFEKKRASFYQGYESITPISKEEKRLIPYGGLAIWLHYICVHVERFNDFSNHFFSEEFLKYWLHTVIQWMEFNQIKINANEKK